MDLRFTSSLVNIISNSKEYYTPPPDTLEQFEQVVSAGKRSAVIAELMREWLDKQRREQLRRKIIEGCREMADVYRETEREYHPLEEEVHRGLDAS